MNQSIATWKDFYERTEVTYAADDTVVDLSDLCGRCASFNASHRCLGAVSVHGCNDNGTVIVNIDGRSSLLLNRADVLAAGADQETNLFWIDLGLE